MTDQQKNMARKIRGLLNLANDAATTPEEAASAAAMAAELGLKYNIELEAAIDAAATKKVFGEGETAVTTYPRDRSAQWLMVDALSALYGCKALMYKGKSNVRFVFIGQAHNVDMANTWTRYLWNACTRMNREWVKTQSFDDRAAKLRADASFRLSFANVVAKRLRDKLAAMRNDGVSGSTALVVVNWFEAERKEVAAWIDANVKFKTSRASRPRRLDGNAFAAGQRAGQRVGIDEQLPAPRKTAAIAK